MTAGTAGCTAPAGEHENTYFKPGESVSLDFGQSGSYDIALLAPKGGIDGTVSVDMH